MDREPQLTTRIHVRERVASLLSEIAGIPLGSITDSATVDGELAISSVAFVQLCVTVEEEYDVEIDPIRVITLNQFGAIVDYIYNLAVGAERWEQAARTDGAS